MRRRPRGCIALHRRRASQQDADVPHPHRLRQARQAPKTTPSTKGAQQQRAGCIFISFAMDSQESDLLGRSHHLSGHPVYMNEDA